MRRISLAVVALVLVSLTTSPGILNRAAAQSTPPHITSYRVSGAPNYSAPGNESFWNNIGWTNVPLIASVSPGGGHASSVLVKSANDGFNIYVLFRWNDSQGPSFGSSPEEYMRANGQLALLYPQNTSVVKQLFYNSTFYYPDRVAMLWFLNGPRDIVPQMQLNSTGAITSGSANIWHWQSNPTDNNPGDPGFPGGYVNPRGVPIFPPNNASFAENDFTNRTNFYLVGGNVTGPFIIDPFSNPFVILAGNSFSTTNRTWTVEMVRPLVVLQDVPNNVQLNVGSSYFVGFAVWNGRMGESQHIKSVSQWYTLAVSNLSPPSNLASSPSGGVSLTLAAAAGGGLLLAGLIIGIVLKPERKRPGS